LQNLFQNNFGYSVNFWEMLMGYIGFFFKNTTGQSVNFWQAIINQMNDAIFGTGRTSVSFISFWDLLKSSMESAVSGGGGGFKLPIQSVLSFHEGGQINQSNLLRLPGMQPDEGIAKLQAGERVLSRSENQGSVTPMNITFNVRAINPQAQSEEIRQMLEEMVINGRLKVS